MNHLVRIYKHFEISDFLNALAIRRERTLHIFALHGVTTGGFIRSINGALWTNVDEDVINEAGNQSSAE